jgi:hypothetical protein
MLGTEKQSNESGSETKNNTGKTLENIAEIQLQKLIQIAIHKNPTP